MRWNQLRDANDTTPALIERGAVARTFDTPEFAGVTCYEVHARSIINKVPARSRMPFRFTVNPYRGCVHACRFCYARNTHRYLELDAGEDFNSKVVAKVNAPELMRRELHARGWRGDHVAMGTNVDPYQRLEGRYRLMPGIIAALRDASNPFSILTRGTLVLRDQELLLEATSRADVNVALSVAFADDALWREVEPGAPRPRARLDACARLNDSGIGCGIMLAPILPYLTDSHAQLRRMVAACAAAGATSVTAIVLHLRPGAREWYLNWLRDYAPDLLPRYRELYAGGSYAAKSYQRRIVEHVRQLKTEYGITDRRHRGAAPPPAKTPHQPTLF